MPATKIQATESPVGQIFSDAFRFSIPKYQRPYAWTTEQAAEMFDDLAGAARCEHKLEDADPYFLGSIVLVKTEGDAAAEVVDGQQRLTTLTILLSVLRGFVPEFSESLAARLFQKGDPIKGTLDQPRLTIRPQDQTFLEKNMLAEDAVQRLDEINVASLSDSQQNLVSNARLFRDRLLGLGEDECARLVRFIDGYTYLVTVATQDFDSAYRIFTVLNERGLNLSHADILKSEIIGSLPDESQDAYTTKWETEEEDLGRADFAELFSHIRMIFAKTKAREAILREFRTSVLGLYPDKRAFISGVLVPCSDAYEVVTRVDYQASTRAAEVNGLLRQLNLLDNTDWIPPAISWLTRYAADGEATFAFLRDLDRLAASMHVRRLDITQRIDRYGKVLRWIESGAHPEPGSASGLELSDDERRRTIEVLDSDIYPIIRLRLYVMLRLDEALTSGGVRHDSPTISVEHVLPQSPAVGSPWLEWFTPEERAQWTHRLANLVLLTRRKNSAAGNLSFEQKKTSYFTGKLGVSPFAVTTQVLHETEWTPTVLTQRQKMIVTKLRELWRL